MKHSNFTDLDLFIFDAVEYRFASHEPGGIVLTGTAPPHPSRSISRGELEELLRTPNFRYIPQGAARSGAERNLDGLPENFRDLTQEKQKVTLYRQAYAEELLRCFESGLAKRNEPSVKLVLPAVINVVENQIRRQQRKKPKRAGREEVIPVPPCEKTALTWARRYEKSGCNIMALVPRTHRCGNHGSRMEPGELAAFEKLILEYASPLRPAIDHIYERATNFYADLNRDRAEQGLPGLQTPSRSSVYRAIKRMDPYETYLQRYGVGAANKKFAIIEYGVQVLRPMERIEIDEWEVDLMTLISKASLLGQLTHSEVAAIEAIRLIVCVAIDCATRCVVGLTLSRSANSEAAIRTLETVTLDKTAIAVGFGCLAGWHQGGRPEHIAADMGSAFVSEEFKMTAAGLHARMTNPTGGVAKLRSRIERLFGTFASHFIKWFRGRTFPNPQQRGDYNSEAEASLTDQDLLEAFVTYIVDTYHQRPHQGLLRESPAECWDRLIEKYSLPTPVDAMDRRAIFGVEIKRSISGRGVRVFGADFACEELRYAYKHSHQQKARLRFDPLDMGWIAVEVAGIWYPAHDLSGALTGVSFYQWSAFAKTVMDHNRERAKITAEIFHDGLRRLELISAEAANTAQLGRMKFTAEEIDRAEQTLQLGLHLLPKTAISETSTNSDWLSGGFEVGGDDADDGSMPPNPNDPHDNNTPSRKGWRFEDDE